MKKLLWLLLAVAVMISLAACSRSGEPPQEAVQTTQPTTTEPTTQEPTKPTSKDPLVRSWSCRLILDAQKLQLQGVDASLECRIEAEFREDMTYRVTIDQDALGRSVEKFLEEAQDDLIKLACQEYLKQGLTMTQVDTLIRQQYGVSLEEMCRQMLEKIDVEAMLEPYRDMLPTAGTYRREDDILYLTQPDGDGGFAEVAFSYQLDGHKLRLSSEDAEVRKFLDFIGGTCLEFNEK